MGQIFEIQNTATKFTVKASAGAHTRPDLNSHLNSRKPHMQRHHLKTTQCGRAEWDPLLQDLNKEYFSIWPEYDDTRFTNENKTCLPLAVVASSQQLNYLEITLGTSAPHNRRVAFSRGASHRQSWKETFFPRCPISVWTPPLPGPPCCYPPSRTWSGEKKKS